uniref:Uncharacterized protein n=1 Tax=Heterorhabditis bacteriophora TaxID=37862 RepID=A0A1I7WF84_HETBA
MEIVAQLAIGRLRQYERHRNRAILGAGKEPILHSYSTSYDLHHKAITRLLTTVDSQVLMVVFDPIFCLVLWNRQISRRKATPLETIHCLPRPTTLFTARPELLFGRTSSLTRTEIAPIKTTSSLPTKVKLVAA